MQSAGSGLHARPKLAIGAAQVITTHLWNDFLTVHALTNHGVAFARPTQIDKLDFWNFSSVTRTSRLDFGSGPDADLAYQWDVKYKLFSLMEVCALLSTVLIILWFSCPIKSHHLSLTVISSKVYNILRIQCANNSALRKVFGTHSLFSMGQGVHHSGTCLLCTETRKK